jgi:hypothetical protein
MGISHELQNIISRAGRNPKENFIAAAANYLAESKSASREFEKDEFTKVEEATQLTKWIDKNNLWTQHPNKSRFIARGAEQRVYLQEDGEYVIKLNDSIFYEFWFDYFISLLIHNLLFPQTAYSLQGFLMDNKMLHAVVRQPFIQINQATNPEAVMEFLLANGFKVKKNYDYYHDEMSIILEDVHDENVLMKDNILFFVDTVFYLMKPV